MSTPCACCFRCARPTDCSTFDFGDARMIVSMRGMSIPSLLIAYVERITSHFALSSNFVCFIPPTYCPTDVSGNLWRIICSNVRSIYLRSLSRSTTRLSRIQIRIISRIIRFLRCHSHTWLIILAVFGLP